MEKTIIIRTFESEVPSCCVECKYFGIPYNTKLFIVMNPYPVYVGACHLYPKHKHLYSKDKIYDERVFCGTGYGKAFETLIKEKIKNGTKNSKL